jgi:hypothetical protein
MAPKRSAKAFNPLARDEAQIFRALLDGQHMIRGFSNPDIRNKLKDSPHLKDISDTRRQSAKVTRIFNRCHAHGLIAKIPHSRRWRVSKLGRIAMSASIPITRCPIPNQPFEAVCMIKTSLHKTENVRTKNLSAHDVVFVQSSSRPFRPISNLKHRTIGPMDDCTNPHQGNRFEIKGSKLDG